MIRKIEEVVCSVVGSIEPCDLYKGRGNIPAKRVAARDFCLYLMHDRLGLGYRRIASLTGLNQRSVIRNVSKVRTFLSSEDNLYLGYWEKIKEKLNL